MLAQVTENVRNARTLAALAFVCFYLSNIRPKQQQLLNTTTTAVTRQLIIPSGPQCGITSEAPIWETVSDHRNRPNLAVGASGCDISNHFA